MSQKLEDRFAEALARVSLRFDELRDTLATGALSGEAFVRASQEYAELEPVAAAIADLKAARRDMADLRAMAADGSDPEMKALAQEELAAAEDRLPGLERRILLALLPKDAADERNAILEVRAGTGGEEAALFAAELFALYRRYAALQGWRFETLEVNETGLGGYKEASASISGRGVFRRLKYESGVHRVQRVPETEAGGRIHTSAATVAVLPEAEEVDIAVNEADLRVDVFRSQGAGGQSVNTTDSAVRITHLPTGIVVQCQDERSQQKNKVKALKVLRARLYDMERSRAEQERAANRKSQVGSGDRSERIRTYNFPQGRVTDHRINLTLYKIDKVMLGEAMDELIDALIAQDEAERLAELQ